jgi:molecular chaperone GrpE (heat shock protein)
MKREIEKLTKIAGTSQVQYLSLKNEFDAYIARIDGEKKEIKLSELKKIVSKFSKLLEQIRLFLSHLDKNLVDNEQIKGLQLIYESFLAQELSQMGIFQIQSLGFTPDTDLHEILMVKPVTQETLDQLLEREIKLDGEKEIYSLEELN